MKITNGKRKAISPVIATVILIAITLIAAIAIAGFVFGLFGSFTSTPRITFVSASISANGTTCSITLENTGSADATLSGATLTYSGVTNGIITVPTPAPKVAATGAPIPISGLTCTTLTSKPGTTGATYSITVQFNPGSGSTSYSGTFA